METFKSWFEPKVYCRRKDGCIFREYPLSARLASQYFPVSEEFAYRFGGKIPLNSQTLCCKSSCDSAEYHIYKDGYFMFFKEDPSDIFELEEDKWKQESEFICRKRATS